MREIDEVHDAEHQRQSGGEQEQQQAELQSVQDLFDDEQHGSRKIAKSGSVVGAAALVVIRRYRFV